MEKDDVGAIIASNNGAKRIIFILLFSCQTEAIFGVVNRNYCLYVYQRQKKKKKIWRRKKGKMIMPDGSVAKDDTTVPKISFVSCGGCHV